MTTTSYKKVPFFIGVNPETNYGFDIRVFPDMISEFTVVSSNDFSCVEVNECSFSSNKRVMSFMGKTVVYYDAEAQLNLIKQPFSSKFAFRFLLNDPENIGSWIGISPNSTFLQYLYEQDRSKGYRIIFRLEWDNSIIYKTGVFEGDKNILLAVFPVVNCSWPNWACPSCFKS